MRTFGKVITLIILSTLLGTPLAILSLWHQNPPGCNRVCSSEPCPPNACMGGKSLTAGFPFPIVHDNRVDSSPTAGWARIGVEDFQNINIGAFLLDAFLYGVIIVILFAITKSIFKSVKRSMRLG
ncbi:hypothetical protein FM036_08130 [Nostoc sp. HG1]|nr:hypothetical protein [Nostoc sp. HG1]